MSYDEDLTKDLDGRPYAKYSELKVGDVVQVDDAFTCMYPWSKYVVYAMDDGELALPCESDGHGLKGQLLDDGDTLVGVYKL